MDMSEEIKNDDLEIENRDESQSGPKKVLRSKKKKTRRKKTSGKKNPLFVVTNNG